MILLLSLSFKNTPQKVREYFAFGREDKERLLALLCEEKEIDEAVVLVTCNRTEIYVSTESKNATGSVINIILEKCEEIVGRPSSTCEIMCLLYRKGSRDSSV